MKVGDNIKRKDYVVKPLSDFLEEYEDYSYYNPKDFKPQCKICWKLLELEFDRDIQIVRIYKCKMPHGDKNGHDN